MVEGREDPTPEKHRAALRLASTLFLDDALHCLVDGPDAHPLAIGELPPSFRPRIEGDLYRWAVSYSVAGMKLAARPPLPPACVAECLTMYAILGLAAEILQCGPEFGLPFRVPEEEAAAWQAEMVNRLFRDTDFLFLYEGRFDGVGADPDEPVGALMGMENMAYADWFRPFRGHEGHPYFDEAGETELDDCPWF